jgi:hypothetical protein
MAHIARFPLGSCRLFLNHKMDSSAREGRWWATNVIFRGKQKKVIEDDEYCIQNSRKLPNGCLFVQVTHILWWISLRSGKYWIRNVRIPAQIQLDFLLVAVQQGLSKIHPNNYNFIWKNKCSLHVGNHILATVSDRDMEERIHYLFFPCHAILFSHWFRLFILFSVPRFESIMRK